MSEITDVCAFLRDCVLFTVAASTLDKDKLSELFFPYLFVVPKGLSQMASIDEPKAIKNFSPRLICFLTAVQYLLCV